MHIIGPHRVTCGSITDLSVDRMLATSTVKVLYCDPPWGDGMLRMFSTMNRKMTGVELTPITHDQLWDRLLSLARSYVRGHVFFETGPRWYLMVAARMVSAGIQNVRYWKVSYKTGGKSLPAYLLAGSTIDAPRIELNVTSTTDHGVEMVKHCLTTVATPGDLVFDPCCGLGITPRAAIPAGMVFYGNELNAARLARTLAYIEKATQKGLVA